MYAIVISQNQKYTYKDKIHVKLPFPHFFVPKDGNNHKGKCTEGEEISYRPHENIYLLCIHGCLLLYACIIYLYDA